MKYKIMIAVIGLCILGSCAPSANSHLEDHLTAYNWRIIFLKHTNIDQTNQFTPYIFNFESKNTIIATKVDSTFQGTWARSNNSQENPKVLLSFGSHYELSLLNYDWLQKSRTDFIIELVDEMRTSGSESVTFERI